MSYYQKYRSQTVADLDLSSVREAFKTMMVSGQVAHAYLFVGPRGLGKTSAARILAKLVNCEKNNKGGKLNRKLQEPCGECTACTSIRNGSAVDVMEIDAASHRGIDDIRDLREKVNLAPVSFPRKVYIIDEVHMLTTEAFNALLKTLEEPPEHVLFVLCTTEAHKVPETIVSRCVRINFTKATKEELVRSLSRAATGEGLKMDEEALSVLADGLDGSFREGHKILEQLVNKYREKITTDNVREMTKEIGGNAVNTILSAVAGGGAKEVVLQMKQLESDGVEVVSLITKILLTLEEKMRGEVTSGRGISLSEMRLMRRLIRVVPKVKISPLPFLPLEMVFVSEALRNSKPGFSPAKVVKKNEVVEPVRVQPKVEVKRQVVEEESQSQGPGSIDFEQVVAGWHDLLGRLAPRNHSVAGLLRSAKPKEISDKFLTIEVFYKFHKEQLEQEARRRMIEEEVAKMWGPISVRCVLGEKTIAALKKNPGVDNVSGKVSDEDMVKAAEEVFGV